MSLAILQANHHYQWHQNHNQQIQCRSPRESPYLDQAQQQSNVSEHQKFNDHEEVSQRVGGPTPHVMPHAAFHLQRPTPFLQFRWLQITSVAANWIYLQVLPFKGPNVAQRAAVSHILIKTRPWRIHSGCDNRYNIFSYSSD